MPAGGAAPAEYPQGVSRKLAALTALIALTCGGVTAFLLFRDSGSKLPEVILYGDSLSVESGRYVEASLLRAGKVEFVNRAVAGSAPCDWIPRATTDASKNPAAVIVETYGNNVSPCQLTKAGNRYRSGGRAYWAQYQTDLRRFAKMFSNSTAVVLTAAPAAYNDISKDGPHKARMLKAMRSAMRGISNASVIDAGREVELPGGKYTRILPCIKGEKCANKPAPRMTYVRAEDGIHFCPPVLHATIKLLEKCPVRASGAWRFGRAQAAPVIAALGLRASNPTKLHRKKKHSN